MNHLYLYVILQVEIMVSSSHIVNILTKELPGSEIERVIKVSGNMI